MRIAIVMDNQIVNAAYRAAVPFNALAARGHEVIWNVMQDGCYDLATLTACDIVYIHRRFDSATQRMARAVSSGGVALWWDNDDDIRALPKGAPNYDKVGGLRGERIFAGMTKMLRLADLVTTPSAVLADGYRALGVERVRVIENYLPESHAALRRQRRRDELVVGWIAGLEHRLDVEHLCLRETLERVSARHSGVRFVCVGVDLALRGHYRHLPKVRFEALATTAAEFDVGLAPVADIALNRARSNVKLKEYAAVGTPWLASPVGPYVGLGKQEGGLLVGDGDWADALGCLISSRRLRAGLARRGAKWGRSQLISANIGRWEEAAHEAIGRAAARRASVTGRGGPGGIAAAKR